MVVVLGVSIFIFVLLHAIYPSPAIDVLGPRANKVTIAAFNQQNGFNDPWFVQYLHYMGNLLQAAISATPTSSTSPWTRCSGSGGRAAST